MEVEVRASTLPLQSDIRGASRLARRPAPVCVASRLSKLHTMPFVRFQYKRQCSPSALVNREL